MSSSAASRPRSFTVSTHREITENLGKLGLQRLGQMQHFAAVSKPKINTQAICRFHIRGRELICDVILPAFPLATKNDNQLWAQICFQLLLYCSVLWIFLAIRAEIFCLFTSIALRGSSRERISSREQVKAAITRKNL